MLHNSVSVQPQNLKQHTVKSTRERKRGSQEQEETGNRKGLRDRDQRGKK